METYSKVIGLPVLSAEDGKKAGNVIDVFFCPDKKRVIAFIIDTGHVKNNKSAVLPGNVRSLGKDALIIDSRNSLIKEKDFKLFLSGIGRLIDLRVYSKQGEFMGTVKDIIFDHKTGNIEGFKVSYGLLNDIIEGRNVIPLFGKVEFSADYILVSREAVEEMKSTGGGLKKKFFNG
ncbi:MAG TPA: photosystem reaction center subunit H [Clostridiaceae bacterium]|nr:photosystem reaction center subunit H [Clostridiaceae bacterium]